VRKNPQPPAVEARSLRGPVLASFLQLCAVLGLGSRTVRTLIAKGLPVAQRGHGNQPDVFDLAAVMAWHRKTEGKSITSVQLERWRRLRADAQEILNREKRGELVNVHKYQEQVRPGFDLLRRTFESIVWEFGPEAGKRINEAIQTAINQGEKMTLEASGAPGPRGLVSRRNPMKVNGSSTPGEAL
jgi:hypothetical protein